jgi:hypothetical protein
MMYTQIVNAGLTADTIPLVNWICAACTAQVVAGVQSNLGHAPLRAPLADNALQAHHHQLFITKVPGLLSLPTTVGVTQISSSLGTVAKLHNCGASTRTPWTELQQPWQKLPKTTTDRP